MALDNAQFMSELSIVDPPGTDPLSEGDDQIRTSKRTQLQSFPNVDAAVTKTAAELNDVALLSFPNLFTVQQTVSGDIIIQQTTTASKFGLFYNSETSFRRWAILREETTISGNLLFQRRDAAGAIVNNPIVLSEATGQILASSGSATVPQYSFQSSPDMGFFRNGNTSIGFVVGGATAALLLAAQFRMQVSGSVTNPAYSFQPDTGMGMYRQGSNLLSFAVAGVEQMRMKAATINMPNLPLSDVGLQTNDLFISSGFIAIVP